ncbi:MAG: hypothetical protein A2014_12260 [Spirochaetes bacterium GWF1_49_6]|nr:MAG: hypothetical protein A2014_12260 [Spirochaetes bacterium GWF1_49_6]
MDMATSGLNSFIDIAADGYGRKSKQGLGSYLLTKGIDMAKYGMMQNGWLGDGLKNKYAGHIAIVTSKGPESENNRSDRNKDSVTVHSDAYGFNVPYIIGHSFIVRESYQQGITIAKGINWAPLESQFKKDKLPKMSYYVYIGTKKQ